MSKCCICGNTISGEANDLIVDGIPQAICDSCSMDLDKLGGVNHNEGAACLSKKMIANGSNPHVFEAVKGLIDPQEPDLELIQEVQTFSEVKTVSSEPAPSSQKKAENPAIDSRKDHPCNEDSQLEKLSGRLEKVADILVIGGIILSLAYGIRCISNVSIEIGLGVLFGGIVISILSYIVNKLALDVASAVGETNRKMNLVLSELSTGNKQIARIARCVVEPSKQNRNGK